MKLIIGGREYPAVNHATASLLHLMELKQQTRAFTDDGKGLGMAALEQIGRSAAKAQADGEAPENADLWMAVMVFLTRRGAGDQVSFLDAIDVPLASIEVVTEPGDQASDADGAADGDGDPTTGTGPASPETPADAQPEPAAAG